MKCIKCGAYIYNSDKFCRNCGISLQENNCKYKDNIENSKYDATSCHEKQYNYSYNYSNKAEPKYNLNATHQEQYDYTQKYSFDPNKYSYVTNYSTTGDDKYIQTYIGQNYNIIKTQKFSIPALFFGIYYLLYRKVWGYATLILLINVAATILLNEEISNLINIISNIYIGFKFTEIYMKKVENHVEKIKQENLDKTTEELLTICKKKGGTSFKGILLLPLIFISIIALILIILYPTINKNVNINAPSKAEETTKPQKNYSISYSLPQEYIKNSLDENTNIYLYTIPETNTTCKITIKKEEIIKNEDDYLIETLLEENPKETISTPTIITFNYTKWKYSHIELQNKSDTKYITRAGNQYFVIHTSNQKINETANNTCNEHYNNFMNSIKITN